MLSPLFSLAFLTHCEYFEINLSPVPSLLHFLFIWICKNDLTALTLLNIHSTAVAVLLYLY